MNTGSKSTWPIRAWLVLVLGAGLVARFWVATLGHNFDLESYRIVADLTAQGQNVYAGTIRYNYGPVWFNIIHLLDILAGHNPDIFRWLLIGLLSAADIGIFFVLWKKFSKLAATLFFLNPVSILITGFHNQFDNLAILIGLCALLLFGDDFDRPLNRRKYAGLAVLGLSLMTKHIFFLFPFWLAVKQRGLLQKCIILVIPAAIFLAGFLPYWSGSQGGIVQNVFEYKSSPASTTSFYDFFLPAILKSIANAKEWWLFFLVLFAFICRGKKSLESMLIYTGVLVATSPAMANQYFAIPVALVSVEVNLLSIAYTLSAAAHILSYRHGPALLPGHTSYDDIAMMFLVLTLIWVTWRQSILHFLQICRQEIRRQFEQAG